MLGSKIHGVNSPRGGRCYLLLFPRAAAAFVTTYSYDNLHWY